MKAFDVAAIPGPGEWIGAGSGDITQEPVIPVGGWDGSKMVRK